MAQLPSTSSILQLANTLSYTSPSNPPTITQKLLPLPSIISVTTTTTTTPTVASLSNTTNLLNTLKTGVPESDLKVLSAFLSNLASPYVKRVRTADGEETTLDVPVNALPAMHGLAVAKVKAGAQVLGNCKGNEGEYKEWSMEREGLWEGREKEREKERWKKRTKSDTK
jgi:hypothetical protein